jgi:hypothetical protein
MRYQSFNNENEFREAIQKRQPEKIDIGGALTSILYLLDPFTHLLTHSLTHSDIYSSTKTS